MSSREGKNHTDPGNSRMNLQLVVKAVKNLHFWDFFVGIPAGLVTFISGFLLTKITSSLFSNTILFLMIFMIVDFLVGMLVGIVRFQKSPSTSLVSGLTAAILMMYLWVNTYPFSITITTLVSLYAILLILLPIFGAKLSYSYRGAR